MQFTQLRLMFDSVLSIWSRQWSRTLPVASSGPLHGTEAGDAVSGLSDDGPDGLHALPSDGFAETVPSLAILRGSAFGTL
jgi:hypothetical protein